ncbi:GL16141 [Drosophila persimilis]|uniref:Glutathione peroxidase n=3 Tax=pseudoobscura subgroup TaxID=32358 RepID=Q29ET2_DROPS|nr:probable phospholipid hydroperoxide glutathione peroxidase isoform X2 [Drosophila pseudoobscura]XP_002026092.1 probable phospholipid hydroperoxide glutathione peroxidase isoform X1 [Drosophila persimilis]XP_017135100.1 probable phospholipid hydroperoxide glutathione peroxidase isoform X1 [Drosophila miranda]EDW33015.1 GL16141 [Drosophila persimilis]
MSLRQFQTISQQVFRCLSTRAATSRRILGPVIELSQSQRQNLKFCTVLLPVSCAAAVSAPQYSTAAAIDMSANGDYKNAASIYEFTVKDTHGSEVSLDKYKGRVLLVVNIASKCGLTKNNYQKLTELKEKFGERGLTILNFPCNQFNSQMPEADGEAMVCHLRDAKADIGEIFARVDVNGDNAAPVYKYLKAKQSGTLGSGLKWNFTKFLVNKEGIPINRYAPTTDPMDIAKDIEKLL